MNLLKSEKSAIKIFLFAAFALTFVACQPEETLPVTFAEEEVETVQLDAEMEAQFDEVESYSLEAMEITDASASARPLPEPSELVIPSCATVTHDSTNKIITIDFGTGCTGPDGKTRAGIIQIAYTQRLYIPGASLTISLINFSINNNEIEGTKTITNVSTSFQAPISLNVSLVGGQISFVNGDVATREVDKTYTWIRASHPALDEFHVDGEAEGVNRNGKSYSCKVISTLIWKRKCKIQGIKVPVQGIKLVKKTGRPNVLVDFGDGECDSLVTLTANGQSKVVDLANL